MSLAENPQDSYAEEALQKYGYQQEFRRELKRFASISLQLIASLSFLQHF